DEVLALQVLVAARLDYADAGPVLRHRAGRVTRHLDEKVGREILLDAGAIADDHVVRARGAHLVEGVGDQRLGVAQLVCGGDRRAAGDEGDQYGQKRGETPSHGPT